jgi:hypothetical protein
METSIDIEPQGHIIDPALITQILVNIKSLITQMTSQPTIQNLLASSLTLSIPREQAADITGVSVWKIDRGRQLLQTLDASQLTLKVIRILIIK